MLGDPKQKERKAKAKEKVKPRQSKCKKGEKGKNGRKHAHARAHTHASKHTSKREKRNGSKVSMPQVPENSYILFSLFGPNNLLILSK